VKNFQLPLGQFPNDAEYIEAFQDIQQVITGRGGILNEMG
jgi:hypothetical protein